MIEQIHANFWHKEERADVQLVSEARWNIADDRSETRWGVRWCYASDKPDDVSRFPSEKEARVHYEGLRAQASLS